MTAGYSRLCEDGNAYWYFLPVKISNPVITTFACPCFPVFDFVVSTILQGNYFNKMYSPFLNYPADFGVERLDWFYTF